MKYILLFLTVTLFCYTIAVALLILKHNEKVPACVPKDSSQVAVMYSNGECAIWPSHLVKLGR